MVFSDEELSPGRGSVDYLMTSFFRPLWRTATGRQNNLPPPGNGLVLRFGIPIRLPAEPPACGVRLSPVEPQRKG